jgi:hypothetical protein
MQLDHFYFFKVQLDFFQCAITFIQNAMSFSWHILQMQLGQTADSASIYIRVLKSQPLLVLPPATSSFNQNPTKDVSEE